MGCLSLSRSFTVPFRRNALAALSLAVAFAACAKTAPRAKPAAVEFVAAPGDEPSVRDQDIAFYTKRLAEDPMSATDRSRLALLHLARARAQGSVSDIERAESLAVASLKIRESRNAATWSILASARLAKHDFVGARHAAEQYLTGDSSAVTAKALLGEVLLELGEYDRAASLFRSLEGIDNSLTTLARLGRWYELTGRLDRGRTVAQFAARRARFDGNLSREQIAWFQLRVGELAHKRGDFDAADSAFALGLRINPNDFRILSASARLALARGNADLAIQLAERVVADLPDPVTLGVLSAAWRAKGDSAQARAYFNAMTRSALTQPGAIHRAWGLYLVDRGQRVGDVLRRVRKELATRHDVYGYDLLAWSLHAMGRDKEAWRAMERALALGTEDSQLAYHAAEIAQALGDSATAARQRARLASLAPATQSFVPVPAHADVSP